MRPIIIADDLGKQYRLGRREAPYKTVRESIMRALRSPFGTRGNGAAVQTFWALKDIGFQINPGEVIGVIGRNGAGKSTLLKVLSRVTEPTTGSVELFGHVGTLLEVGTGFHPELTGRENIFLNGAILGMKRTEIARKFDEIVGFAEIERFIDTPVKHYSSGMYVRLAFAVAAHLEPDILLVDEVLAVGDAHFQKRCLGRMGDVAREGRTILFVSHNMAAVMQLCQRGMLLEDGHLSYDGSVEEAVAKYQSVASAHGAGVTRNFPPRTGTGKIRFKEIEVVNEDSEPCLYSGSGVNIRIALDAIGRFRASNVTIGIGINGPFGERLATLLNKYDASARLADSTIGPDTTVVCTLSRLLLRPGSYFLSLYIDIDGEVSDRIKDAVRLEIHDRDFYGTGVMPTITQGALLLDQSWHYR